MKEQYYNMLIKKITAVMLFPGIACILLISWGCTNKSAETMVTSVQKKFAWAVGNKDSTGYAMILFTPDGGITWQRQGGVSPALQGIDLYGVMAWDANTVWAVGTGNSIIKTSNGGNTWTLVPCPLVQPSGLLQSVSMAGPGNIWISGSGGRVFNSTDGGDTWVVFDTAFFHSGLMQGIHAVNSRVIYVAGGIKTRGFIARTSDGGRSWDSIVPANGYNRNEWIGVKSSDSAHIVVYGGKSHYVASNDAGQTWWNDSVTGTGGMGGADINCLTMPDAQTWWGAFDYEGIFITSDGGGTWLRQTSAGPGGMWLFGIDFYDRNMAVIVAQSSSSFAGKIITTTDGGQTWKLTYPSRSWINKVSFCKH